MRYNGFWVQAIRAAFLMAACGLFFSPALHAADTVSPAGCATITAPNPLLWLARQCAKDLTANAQCRAYAKDGGVEYVILRDCAPQKPHGYLIIPTQPVTGIEDSRIFASSLTDIWEEGWIWSRKYPGMPEARTGLALNSRKGRSQNQLHIHISCVRDDVSRALASAPIPSYPQAPLALELGPRSTPYRAVKIAALQGSASPFSILKVSPAATADMQDQSIAVIGTGIPGEYYMLSTTARDANPGRAEELLDQTCAF